MEYKLVALDLDDTLLLDDQTLEPEARDLILQLQDRGIEFIIATGRTYSAAIGYVRELEISTPVVCHNGAYVRQPGGDVVSHDPIPLELARKILRYCEEQGLEICVYIEDSLYFRRRNRLTHSYESTSGIQGRATENFLSEEIESPPSKMLILEDDERRQKYYLEELKEFYQKRLNITTSKPEFIEIISGGVDKSRALQEIAAGMGIEFEDVLAVGNGFNDLGMLKWAGLGIAVDNAPAGVREGADRITASNEKAGVARVLKRIFFDEDE